jgi:hypothetical protein
MKKNEPDLTNMLSQNEVEEEFVSLIDSCVEGYTGDWDPTGEDKDGFVDMKESLEKLARHFKIDVSKSKQL